MDKDEPYTAQFALIRKRKIPLIQAGSMGVSMPQPEAGDVGRVLTVKSDLSLDWEPPSGGGVLVASRTLSNSDLRSTTAFELVPAQGADTIIVCSNFTVVHNYGGTNVWTSIGAQQIGYQEPTMLNAVTIAGAAFTLATSNMRSGPYTSQASGPISTIINQPLSFRLATGGTGNAANDNTATVFVEYYVITL